MEIRSEVYSKVFYDIPKNIYHFMSTFEFPHALKNLDAFIKNPVSKSINHHNYNYVNFFGILLFLRRFRYGVIILLVRFLFNNLLNFSKCGVRGKNVLISAKLNTKLIGIVVRLYLIKFKLFHLSTNFFKFVLA